MSIEANNTAKKRLLRKKLSLKTKKEFEDVFDLNTKFVLSPLVIYGKQGEQSRMGLVVSKKIGHAPCRNKIKRQLREVFRRVSKTTDLQLVVIARKKASVCSYKELEESFVFILNKLSNRLASPKKQA